MTAVWRCAWQPHTGPAMWVDHDTEQLALEHADQIAYTGRLAYVYRIEVHP